jgi:hypothetical protein
MATLYNDACRVAAEQRCIMQTNWFAGYLYRQTTKVFQANERAKKDG